MPSPSEILFGLSSIANEWRQIATAWHIVLGVSLLALLAGWRPSARVAAYALTSLFVSVASAALAFGNVVNGTVFTVLFLACGALARRLPGTPIRMASPVLAISGMLLVMFGWGYPHFLETDHWTEYAYAAPMGILPCPTLASVAGLSLVCGHFGSRAWAYTVTAAGLVYAVMGVFALGVTLDYGLLIGSLAAAVTFEWSTRHIAPCAWERAPVVRQSVDEARVREHHDRVDPVS